MDTPPTAARPVRYHAGLVVAVAFAVVLVWVVEWMALGVAREAADGKSLFVLGLFVVPTLIALAAIAKSLGAWSPRARWISALLILLVPPALLLLSGAFHG